MIRLLVITVLTLLYSLAVTAQRFTVDVSSDSILIGNYIALTFTLENIDGQFEAPEFVDLELVSGPNTSTSVQIINGDKTSKTTYSYYVKPLEMGLTIIPPAYVVSEDLTLETTPIELNVYPNPDKLIINPERDQQTSFFEFRDFSPFGKSPQPPKVPASPTKPKRKYKKI